MSSPVPPPSAPVPNAPSPTARRTRAVTLAALLALTALCLAWELWLAPLRPGGSWLALKALPLLLPLPGLLRLRMLSYRKTALFIWLYFVEGVVRATSDRAPSAWYAWGEVLLTIVLFAACAAHVRLRQRQARAAGLSAASPS